jgi:hypothetical protein
LGCVGEMISLLTVGPKDGVCAASQDRLGKA